MADNPRQERSPDAAERQHLHYRAGFDYFLASDRATVDLGIEVLRNAVLLNGGAAVALLAFMNGGGVSVGARCSVEHGVMLFALGALTAGVAAATAYFYQSFHAEQVRVTVGKDETFTAPDWLGRGKKIAACLLVTLAAISYSLFAAGAVVSALAFNS